MIVRKSILQKGTSKRICLAGVHLGRDTERGQGEWCIQQGYKKRIYYQVRV